MRLDLITKISLYVTRELAKIGPQRKPRPPNTEPEKSTLRGTASILACTRPRFFPAGDTGRALFSSLLAGLNPIDSLRWLEGCVVVAFHQSLHVL